ncbi:hypothetical protein MIND_01148300 [Mycena indigotica]|uniref:HAT C-terminal dimerisation domain-containing protein n=1 Tax=Mycena indigotica TaxID=2126181 RepID=A0A8H6S6H2_9AGAR|nr:uncharacterized protein MIND_01148300 [Mycena indigotica]KAF7293683.1 hypothetical protein MIND_01148300 [Mycena indigotica]
MSATTTAQEAANRQWQRQHFRDDPAVAANRAAGIPNTGKTKVICRQHLQVRIQEDRLADLANGLPQRSEDDLLPIYFATDAKAQDRMWMQERPDTLLNHLSKDDLEQRKAKPKGKSTAPTSTSGAHILMPFPSTSSNDPAYNSLALAGQTAFQYAGMGLDSGTVSFPSSFDATIGSSTSFAFNGIPFEHRPRRASSPSLVPGDSISEAGTVPGLSRQPSFHGSDTSNKRAPPMQQQFEYRIARLTASGGLPLSWIENPEALALFALFVPGAVVPSRAVLTRRLIPAVLKELQDEVKKRVRGSMGTLQADGWTGIDFHHLIAFMLAAAGHINTVDVYDVSDERKTAVNFLRLMMEVLEKVDKGFLKWSKEITDLIGWLRSKTFVLALLRELQRSSNLPVLAIIRAVLTRWTSHYLAYTRLIAVGPPLRALVAREDLRGTDNQLITGDSKAKKKAQKMVALIKNPQLWAALERMRTHLSPLALCANMTQTAFCRLDQDPEDQFVRAAVLASVERRWGKCDQDVFLAAAIANPFLDLNDFMPLPILTRGAIFTLWSRLHLRFEKKEADPATLLANINDFFNKTGSFDTLPKLIPAMRAAALREKCIPDPLALFGMLSFPGRDIPDSPFMAVTKRALNITANSASCERLFSVFGAILTKTRNRLGKETLRNLAELKMLIRDEHLRNGDVKPRLKRKFEQATPDAQAPLPSTIIASTDASTEPDSEMELDSSAEDPATASLSTSSSSEFHSLAEQLTPHGR